MKVYGARPKDCGNCGFSCNCGGKLSRKETAMAKKSRPAAKKRARKEGKLSVERETSSANGESRGLQ